MVREVVAGRYVLALREGGSLPGLVEEQGGPPAGERALWVAKFHGAAQGRKALVAELVAGELARRLGFRVPELTVLQVDPRICASEPDQEVQDLVKASPGANLGMAFLSGALGYDPAAFPVDPRTAGRVIWFDALVGNVDRSWRNPNLLVHGGELWLIDHGASLVFHHHWPTASDAARRRFSADDHVLARFRPDLAAADAELGPLVTGELLDEVLALVPDAWLPPEPGYDTPDALRAAYRTQLLTRAAAPRQDWLPVPPAPPEPEQLTPLQQRLAALRAERAALAAPPEPSLTEAQPPSQEPQVYEYAAVRVVPRVERGDAINAGVLVYSRQAGALECAVELDEARLLALDPDADVPGIRAALAAVAVTCTRDVEEPEPGRRFRWLTAPRSTVVQPGPVHCGLSPHPATEARRLLAALT